MGWAAVAEEQKIYVIEDDPQTAQGLRLLLEAAEFSVETFDSVSAFFADHKHKEGCLVLDVRMSGINWLEFQIELGRRNHDLVILVISTYDDMPMVIGAMRAGAIDFIEKPFDAKQIVASVRRALGIRTKTHDWVAETDFAKAKIALLTARERSIAEELLKGNSNKTVAQALGISPRTVEVHRAHILKKLELENIPDLVRLWYAAGEVSHLFSGAAPKRGIS